MASDTESLVDFNPTLENITDLLRNEGTGSQQRWFAYYRGLKLFSHFQPIYSYALHRQVGFEALVRATDENNNIILPNKIFRGGTINEMLAIDRICRCLHLANFQNILKETDAWLFLNVNPLIVSEHIPNRSPFMKEVLAQYNIPPNRIIIEILETAISNETNFLETIKYYRKIGCMIAIDDFGAGHSNFNRIWDCHPEFVKLDKSIFTNAINNKKLRKSIPRLVSLLHEYGCMVLAEGIETYEQAILCMDSEFDLIQGFLFSEPLQSDELLDQSNEIWSVLKEKFKNNISYKSDELDDLLAPFIEEFHYVAMAVKDMNKVEQACNNMLNREKVLRFYMINGDGEQKSANINSKHVQQNYNPLYAPLQQVSEATWYHRQYFRKAVNNIGKIQVTGPYFSITDAKTCITLSLARNLDDKLFVLCCDIEI